MRTPLKRDTFIAYLLILALLLPMGQYTGYTGENEGSPTINQEQVMPNLDRLKLSVSIDDAGNKRIDELSIQWTMELNGIEAIQSPSRIHLTLSPGQVFAAVVAADPGLMRVSAILHDGNTYVLYDTENTLSGP